MVGKAEQVAASGGCLGFGGGDLIKYPLCGMNFLGGTLLSACIDRAKWLLKGQLTLTCTCTVMGAVSIFQFLSSTLSKFKAAIYQKSFFLHTHLKFYHHTYLLITKSINYINSLYR